MKKDEAIAAGALGLMLMGAGTELQKTAQPKAGLADGDQVRITAPMPAKPRKTPHEEYGTCQIAWVQEAALSTSTGHITSPVPPGWKVFYVGGTPSA